MDDGDATLTVCDLCCGSRLWVVASYNPVGPHSQDSRSRVACIALNGDVRAMFCGKQKM
jgi:hypothetical protein